MRALGIRYTHYFNRRYDRVGTIWNGRYKGKHIRDATYWLTCLRYVELNPIRAGIVTAAENYEWSSYRVHAFGEPSDWLAPHAVYDQLGATPLERHVAYRELCRVGI